MAKSLVSKACKGIEYGDVSNYAVRNVLTAVSREIAGGKISKEDMKESLDFFGWKCPYTGRDLKPSFQNNISDIAVDHIVPQNREECGLNLKGNLIWVDKIANGKKGQQSVEDFLLNDNTVLNGVPLKVRQERLDKIREFQKKNNYDPSKIKKALHPFLLTVYSDIQADQAKRKKDAINLLPKGMVNQMVKAGQKSAGNNLANDKVSSIVNEMIVLLESGAVNQSEVDKMLTLDYARDTFKLSSYPMLTKTLDDSNKKRYYKKPICIAGNIYYVCSQSTERNRDALIKWVNKHK